jgi:glycosyltransferase involved in cell wall biosynthesis
MKVLHVITGLGVGGAELQLRAVLQQTRHDADVVTLYNPGPVADMIRADGTAVRALDMQKNTQLSAFLRLRRIIRAGRYDVVHAHLYRSQIYGRPAAWLAGTPVVVSTEHSIGETHLERRRMTLPVQALYLATELFSDMTIAVSTTVRDRMNNWGVRARKLTVIPNGVDLDRVAFDRAGRTRVRAELGIGADDYVVLLLGRLDKNKQFDRAIEAAAPSLSPTAKIVVAGGGAEREHLAETARQCGVADYVIFAGERHDVAAVLSAADLLVASSRQETFGLSVLEALANGIRVLYTTCPALAGMGVKSARQVAIEDMGKVIAEEITAGPAVRAPEPVIASEFGIAAVTTRIDDLYERLAARWSWRTVASRVRRRAREEASARAHVVLPTAGSAATPVLLRRPAAPTSPGPARPLHTRPPHARPSPARASRPGPTRPTQTRPGPAEKAPADTVPADTVLADTVPTDALPAENAPAETELARAAISNTTPANSAYGTGEQA